MGDRHRARGAGRRTRSRRGCGARCGADELRLHYQPIFALESGELVALEALLRWEDPVHGMISPAEFIPVAEQTGLIDALGDWVLEAVCAQQIEWTERGPAAAHLLQRLAEPAAPRRLPRRACATGSRRPASTRARLTVELTESSTLEDPALAEAVVRELDALGLRIALDDFGTGYSSLSRLRELPVSTLKIDRSFMRDVPELPGGGRDRDRDPAARPRARPHRRGRGRGDRGAARVPRRARAVRSRRASSSVRRRRPTR